MIPSLTKASPPSLLVAPQARVTEPKHVNKRGRERETSTAAIHTGSLVMEWGYHGNTRSVQHLRELLGALGNSSSDDTKGNESSRLFNRKKKLFLRNTHTHAL